MNTCTKPRLAFCCARSRTIAAVIGATVGACAQRGPTLEYPVGVSMGARITSAETAPPRSPKVVAMREVEPCRVALDDPSARSAGAAVVVGHSVLSACGIAQTPPVTGFRFDSAELKPTGETLLARIAACARDGGPLASARFRITGHADPRGTRGYNDALGTSRALAARDALVAAGLDAVRFEIVSRGESDAKGTDEATWGFDRRIDIELAAEPDVQSITEGGNR